jgi:dTDP-4-dehydrorhamnose 3,5-epimerase
MLFRQTALSGVKVVELEPHEDDRGSFARTFCVDEFAAARLPISFPQCNISINDHAGTLRGLHFNVEQYGEAKLVRCVRGAIHDVVVDLRGDSPTRFQHLGIDLTAQNRLALFVPPGVAHGFLTLEDATDVYYHMGSRYEPRAARGLRWDDPSLGIEWPRQPARMSETDAAYPDVDPSSFDLATYA